jgi:hypothetical protein
MGEAVDTARPAVSAVLTLMNEIDKDPDLNPQGESVKSAARVAQSATNAAILIPPPLPLTKPSRRLMMIRD